MRKLIRRRPRQLQRVWRSRLYIREHRTVRGMSLQQLAEAIGKTKGMLSLIENGHCNASPTTLEDMAAFFGLRHVGLLFEPPPPMPAGWQMSIVPKNTKNNKK